MKYNFRRRGEMSFRAMDCAHGRSSRTLNLQSGDAQAGDDTVDRDRYFGAVTVLTNVIERDLQ